ncbi:hypothetical protein GCM10023108_27810 [Saccharopolyspora hordei]|uniref:Putative PurR-regulated permease PerM n=1 Tax=Saccharopolyspora hordei TaxID=1838 RepID=A0A853AS87_9PSEU|nr:putative PurR-regulated permease PerM [Saccharopolyspora hordei]
MLVLVGGLCALGAVLAVVVGTLVEGFSGLSAQLTASFERIHRWLLRGPLDLDQQQLDEVFRQLTQALRIDQGGLPTTALATTGTLLRVLAGTLLGLFTLFFLRGAGRTWSFVVGVLVPRHVRDRVHVAGRRGFGTPVAHVRATAAVAFLDAALIGTGAAVPGVPLPFVLAVVIFLYAFVPCVGAVVPGGLAVLGRAGRRRVRHRVDHAGVGVGVMQVEGHVLQPLLLGHAVRLHPLAVVLSVASGSTAAGVGGAVLAVPLVATANTVVRSLAADSRTAPGPGADSQHPWGRQARNCARRCSSSSPAFGMRNAGGSTRPGLRPRTASPRNCRTTSVPGRMSPPRNCSAVVSPVPSVSIRSAHPLTSSQVNSSGNSSSVGTRERSRMIAVASPSSKSTSTSATSSPSASATDRM